MPAAVAVASPGTPLETLADPYACFLCHRVVFRGNVHSHVFIHSGCSMFFLRIFPFLNFFHRVSWFVYLGYTAILRMMTGFLGDPFIDVRQSIRHSWDNFRYICFGEEGGRIRSSYRTQTNHESTPSPVWKPSTRDLLGTFSW